MELTLLGVTGVLAFLIVGAAVMLVSTFRRTIEQRGALIAALERIERLEQQLGAALEGRDIAVIAKPEARALIAREAEPALLPSPRKPRTQAHAAPPAPEPEPARLDPPPEPSPAAAPASPETAHAVDHVAPADAPPQPEAPAPANAVAPPHLGVLALLAILVCFAVLAAARVGALTAPVAVALAIGVGLAVLGAAEWRRAAEPLASGPPPAPLFALAPDHSALAALLGLSVLLGAILYGRIELGAPSPLLAFIAVAAVALSAGLLSLRHGASLMAFAALVAAIAPALAPAGGEGSSTRYAFLFMFAAAAMALSRVRQAPLWTWAGSAIALIWGAGAAAQLGAPQDVSAGAVYFAALAALGLAYAWPAAGEHVPFPIFWAEPQRWREANFAGGSIALTAGAALTVLLIARPTSIAVAGACLAGLAVFSVGMALLRAGLWLAPFSAAALGAAAIALWPAGALADPAGLALLAGTLALIALLGGLAMMTRAQGALAGATLAAFGPIGAFGAAHWRMGASFAEPLHWTIAALAVAAVNALAYSQLAKTRRPSAEPFAAGAALGLTLGAYALAPAPFAPLVLAIAVPSLALIDRWRSEPGLRFAALALCLLLFARAVIPQMFVATASPVSILALHLVPSALACAIAALLFERGPAGPASRAAQYPFAIALLLLAALATLALRHAFTAGAIGAPYASLLEMGANTLIWLSLAALIALRFGAPLRASLFVLEFAAFAGAATHVLVAGGLLINPWWGLAPAPAPGLAGLNAIEAGYAAPAALFLAYAHLRARQGLSARSRAALGVALALFFLALVLELRRLFHGADMHAASVAGNEAWVYSLAALGFAALLLALSTQRQASALRYASLGLALAALAKMALFDAAALGGPTRLALSAALVIAAGAVTMFYRRFVLPKGVRRFKTEHAPNSAQPG